MRVSVCVPSRANVPRAADTCPVSSPARVSCASSPTCVSCVSLCSEFPGGCGSDCIWDRTCNLCALWMCVCVCLMCTQLSPVIGPILRLPIVKRMKGMCDYCMGRSESTLPE
uniref:Uncharacterized protein n=1 Tax=Lotharella globosa TaxID=91324 RepID=A0A7S4DSZ1_9EUKA